MDHISRLVRNCVTLGSAIGWALLFYTTYLCSFAISFLVVGFVAITLSLLYGWLGIPGTNFKQGAPYIWEGVVPVLAYYLRAFTLLGAFYMSLITIYLYLRTLLSVWLGRQHPSGSLVNDFVSDESHDSLSTSSTAKDLLERLINDVTDQLGTSRFSLISMCLNPTARTYTQGRRRILILGWPLLISLTENELKSVVAHEAAHYSGYTMFYHRLVWRLMRHTSRFQEITNRSTDYLERKTQSDNVGIELRAKFTWVIARPTLGLAKFFISQINRLIALRFSATVKAFEKSCDRVSAHQFGSNVLASALKKVRFLSEAYLAFLLKEDSAEVGVFCPTPRKGIFQITRSGVSEMTLPPLGTDTR